ncbi:MAG: hypothetical protein BWK75_03985 [Candidatus Altiarchaeales archaeon A3]|nr:MAG: hypothetical protein BWK75_03985 [Candidatus Altiarchaeales archaeon A3]
MYYFEVLEALYKNKVKYLIVGGLAVNLYGVPRLSQNIDIIISADRGNVLNIISLLEKLGYVPRLPVNPKDMAEPDKVKYWIENKNLKAFSFYHKKDCYKVIDILLFHNLNFEKSFEDKTVKKVKNIEIYLAPMDDLIKMKEFSGRTQDLSDVDLLKKVKKYLKNEENK